jgi:excinuclease ABC subunit C
MKNIKYPFVKLGLTKLDMLPLDPGVYIFLDKNKNILYIGKAKLLKKRVLSYFRDTHIDRPYIKKMLPLVSEIQYITTTSEINALILEASLIKKYKPKYNQELKDDKSYAWIFIDTKSQFPTIKIVRRTSKKDFSNGKLFGPYPSGSTIKNLYKYIRTIYPFCTCTSSKQSKRCLYRQIGLCPGPYEGSISETEYKKNIIKIIQLLSGKNLNILSQLNQEMKNYANQQKFEKAIELRDKIKAIEYISQKIDINPFRFESQLFTKEKITKDLKSLQHLLKMALVKRIECYDISHLKGQFVYGSMSVLNNATFNKSHYRIFKLENHSEDDFQNLYDVLSRRLKHINKDKKDKSLNSKPDIILIDGDIHQLNKLKSLIPQDIILIGISKGRYRRKNNQPLKDEFWIYKNKRIMKLNLERSIILTLLRDEAHRFAIFHNRKARLQYNLESELISIKGIGFKHKKALLKEFKSIKQIEKATLEDINKVIRNKKVSEELYSKFHKA